MDSQTLVTEPVRLPPKTNVTTAVSGGSTCWSGPGARSVGCTKRGPGRFLPSHVWNTEPNVSHGKSDHCRWVPAIRGPSGRCARWPATRSTSDACFASYLCGTALRQCFAELLRPWCGFPERKQGVGPRQCAACTPALTLTASWKGRDGSPGPV